MIYTASITTPKNTPVTSLKKTILRLTKGLVYKVEFHFPSGSAGLMGLAVFDGLYQVWPSSAGEFFVSDNETIRFDDLYLKEAPPYEFQIYTYNTDDTYNHVANVRVGLVSKEAFLVRWLPYKGFEYLTQLIKNIEAERREIAAAQAEQLKETPFEWLLRQEGIEI